MTPLRTADERPRFLSDADCHDLLRRLTQFTTGGGYTSVSLVSLWRGSLRWARNQVSTAGETNTNTIRAVRNIRGAQAATELNDTTTSALVAAARRAERLVTLCPENPNAALTPRLPLEPATAPQIFSETTYQLDADQRAAAALALTQQAQTAGLLSAGYIEVAAVSAAMLDTFGRVRYAAYTQARYSVTVRDPQGTGSGWAGVDHYDWGKIDAAQLTRVALEKCRASQHPVRVEPGRYTTILEPQAVADFVGPLLWDETVMDRYYSENRPTAPFFKSSRTATQLSHSKLGERLLDERITISADPTDPELGIAPFSVQAPNQGDQFVTDVYHPVTWFDRGVLVNLAYPRFNRFGNGPIGSNPTLGRDQDLGLPNSGAFRMSGGTTTIDEMIATTKRGLLVTRFDRSLELDYTSQLYRGYTRDGLWLIENGKISKPAKNLAFTESPLFALNKIEQLGVPQRVFHPNEMFLWKVAQPTIVPPLKISDFSFTALSDAV
jgi:predicted Zn-dependent protease